MKSHSSCIWSIAWSHPSFGIILASAGYDGKIRLWKEEKEDSNYILFYVISDFEESVNNIKFAPYQYGLIIGGCSSDGQVKCFKDFKIENILFDEKIKRNDDIILTFAFSPFKYVQNVNNQNIELIPTKLQVAYESYNCTIKIGDLDQYSLKIIKEENLEGYSSDKVRDISWEIINKIEAIAICSEEGKIFIWKKDEEIGKFILVFERNYDLPIWQLIWHVESNYLFIYLSNGQLLMLNQTKVTEIKDKSIQKEEKNKKEEWEIISKISNTEIYNEEIN